MADIRNYRWYYENGKIAIVTIDSSFPDGVKAVDVSDRKVRIKATHYASDYTSDLDDNDKTYNLPSKFQHMIAILAISRGYGTPPYIDTQIAAHFYRQYTALLKELKTVTRSKGRKTITMVGRYY